MERPWVKFYPRFLPRTLDYPKVPLFEFLETSARRFPDKPCVIYYGKRISYSEILDYVERLATFLHKRGIEKGDRVAIYMQNSAQWIISYFGILRANAVVVPVNPMFVERELEYILLDSGSKIVITTSELYSRLRPVAEKLKIDVICGHLADMLPEKPEIPVPDFAKVKLDISGAIAWDDAMKEKDPPKVKVTHEDLAMIPYTAGTTGVPKGCIHTHYTILTNAVLDAYWEFMTPGTITLATLPYFHITGLQHSLLPEIYAGATIVLLIRWDREVALQAIEKYRCNHWVNITTMVVDLLNDPKLKERDLSSLQFVGGGGAPMPKAVAERFEQLTGLKYTEGYGSTETAAPTHLNPLDNPMYQSAGIPIFGLDSLVIDPESGKILPPGEVGEIVVKGPALFKGYWNKPEETEKAFIEINGEKYFRMGDLGYMDKDGYFYIVDRLKRMIDRAGLKVWPAEVESILYVHPAIKEVCIVGTPDERVGEEVKAYIVLRDEYKGRVSEDDIIKWAKERMAAYKYPRKVEFVNDLPKSSTGKILWRELQEKERSKKG